MLTNQEKKWIMYDVGNSAFIMLVATIIPIYFKNIASLEGVSDSDSTAYWGYAASIATLIIAIIGPILGTVGDNRGYKKKLFLAFVVLGVVSCIMLCATEMWMIFLIIFIFGKVGYSGSLIFYDSMLTDITEDSRLDKVSSLGYGWGYIGSCIPFIISLIIILTANKTGLGTMRATKTSFFINGIWWAIFTIPLLISYEQKYFIEENKKLFRKAYFRIKNTIKDIKTNKKIFT
ncbi:MAG: MFS transporter, partial [Filifactoraceae bacterium]